MLLQVASAVGVGELYLVFETVKCVVIALVQLMVYKSTQTPAAMDFAEGIMRNGSR